MCRRIPVLIALLAFSVPARSEIQLLGERVEVEQKTEVRYDVPDGCVITGIGFRAHQDNVTTMHLRYHRLTPDGKLTDPQTVHLGSEPEHITEAEIYLPDGYVMVGFGARGAPEWDVTTVRVWARPLREDGTLGEIGVFNAGKAPEHGVERSVLLSETDRALTAAGLRMAWNDIAGIYARSRKIVSIDEDAQKRLRALAPTGWMISGVSPRFLDNVLKRTSEFGVNFLLVSLPTREGKRAIPETSEERKPLAQMAEKAVDRKLAFYVWVREGDLSAEPGSNAGVEFLAKVLDEIPQLRGFVVGLRSVGVATGEGDEEAALQNLKTLADACETRGRNLILRADADDREETRRVAAAAKRIPSAVVMVPSVPGEWDSYSPYNPLLGVFPDRKVFIEFDLGEQNSGRSAIPYARPDEIQDRLVTAGLAGAQGVVARIGGANLNTLGSLNEFNLWSLDRLTDDPLQPLNSLWNDYYTSRYGDGANRVISAMRRTRSAVDLIFHVDRFQFLSDGSHIAGIAKAEERLEQGLERWYPELEEMKAKLQNPTEKVLQRAVEEKETASWLIAQCLSDLEAAKETLPPDKYDEIHRPFEILDGVARLWQEWTRVYLLTQIYTRDASPKTLGSLQSAVEDLAESYQAVDKKLGNGFSFGNLTRIRAEVEERIRQTQEASPLVLAFQSVEQLEADEKYDEAAEAFHSLMTDERFVPYLQEHNKRLSTLSSSLHAFGGPMEGIQVKRGADGKWTVEEREGKWCWASTEQNVVIYFDVLMDPLEQPKDFVLTFEYFDEGEEQLYVHYDSDYPPEEERQYHPTDPIQMTDTGEWKEGTFVLDKALFKNSQNVLADLRFIQGGDIIRIRNVKLEEK